MCKICSSCKSVMSYDPYFGAEVCIKCGKIERVMCDENRKIAASQKQTADALKQLMKAMLVNT